MLCRRFRVSGFVQGVGFRYAARIEAQRLDLVGWVRNLSDGDVEALACGNAENLKAFENWLKRGPRAARVSAVVVADAAAETFDSFDVR